MPYSHIGGKRQLGYIIVGTGGCSWQPRMRLRVACEPYWDGDIMQLGDALAPLPASEHEEDSLERHSVYNQHHRRPRRSGAARVVAYQRLAKTL